MKTISNTLCKLPVISMREADEQGFQSITVGIHAETEKSILASVTSGRDPARCALIRIADKTYELALKREDVAHHEENYSRAI